MVHKQKNIKQNAIIDFVIPIAYRGGIENITNPVARYLTQKGIHIRFIQLIYEHKPWACNEVDFYYIYEDRNGQTLESFINGYCNFLKEYGSPNMILANNWPMMCTVAKASIEKLHLNIPIASWIHMPLEQYAKYGCGDIEHLRNADIHFAISDEIRNTLLNYNEKIVYRSYHAINTKKIYYTKYRDPYKLVYIGRLSDEKNIKNIIRALSLTENYELHIIGSGMELPILKELASELNIDSRVFFYGWNEDPWLLAWNCGLFIISSSFEGGPLTAIEALHCGIPVISTPVGFIPEIIQNGVNGYLYPHDDYIFLANILNLIHDGKLSIPSPEACKASAFQYSEDIALFNFYTKIYAAMEWRVVHNDLDKISIIIPCHNAEKKIENCLNNLLTQTIPLAMLELIFVTESSTDSTLDILTKYEAKYPELMMIINCDEACSVEQLQSIGQNYSTGNYITYLSTDDYIPENMIEKMYLAGELTSN